MTTTRISFPQPPHADSKGRNGYVRTTGVEITRVRFDGTDDVWLQPLTSRGAVSDACRLVISASAIDHLIDALRSLRDEPRDVLALLDKSRWTGADSVTVPDEQPARAAPAPGHFFCPECGSARIVHDVARWSATSKDDAGNTGELVEFQCADCSRSIWLGAADTPHVPEFTVILRWSDGTSQEANYADFVSENESNDEFAALEPEMLAALQEGPGSSYRWPVCAGLFVDVVRL